MKAIDPRVSFAELQHWPDDGRRYELYNGEVIVVPTPFPRHQRVALHIGEVLTEYERMTGGLVFDSPILCSRSTMPFSPMLSFSERNGVT